MFLDDTIDCEAPVLLVCLCGASMVTRCNRCTASKCAACAKRFVGRLWHVLQGGTICAPGERLALLTLTVPALEPHMLNDRALCRCTPLGGLVLAEENAMFGKRFNRLVQDLRRNYDPDLQYARVAELQKRGALHYHVLVRGSDDAITAMLAGYRKSDPDCAIRALVEKHGFGHEVDLQPADGGTVRYLLKYVTKFAEQRAEIPWLDTKTGEIVTGADRYRVWTASRLWGPTMREVREVQRAWAQERGAIGSTPEESQPPQAAEAPGRPEGPPS